MSLGNDLIQLQELDLAIEREKKGVAEMPVLAELAKKRKSYARLKAEATRLLGERKDAQTALDDLDAEERACHEGVASAQAQPVDSSDYRQVQGLEDELSDLAKRLDKVEYGRKEARAALAAAVEREKKMGDYIARFEQSIVADTRTAREAAAAAQAKIDADTRERDHILGGLDADVRARYLGASKRFHGLAVERLDGTVPSICRTTLQPASLDELRRAGEVSECPYCHRIIVLPSAEGK